MAVYMQENVDINSNSSLEQISTFLETANKSDQRIKVSKDGKFTLVDKGLFSGRSSSMDKIITKINKLIEDKFAGNGYDSRDESDSLVKILGAIQIMKDNYQNKPLSQLQKVARSVFVGCYNKKDEVDKKIGDNFGQIESKILEKLNYSNEIKINFNNDLNTLSKELKVCLPEDIPRIRSKLITLMKPVNSFTESDLFNAKSCFDSLFKSFELKILKNDVSSERLTPSEKQGMLNKLGFKEFLRRCENVELTINKSTDDAIPMVLSDAIFEDLNLPVPLDLVLKKNIGMMVSERKDNGKTFTYSMILSEARILHEANQMKGKKNSAEIQGVKALERATIFPDFLRSGVITLENSPVGKHEIQDFLLNPNPSDERTHLAQVQRELQGGVIARLNNVPLNDANVLGSVEKAYPKSCPDVLYRLIGISAF